MTSSEVYKYPRYYAIGYRWNTKAECDFIEACLKAHGPANPTRILDIGCGAGRHLTVLAKRGYQLCGVDIAPEMIAYVKEEATKAGLWSPTHGGAESRASSAQSERVEGPITVRVDDLRQLTVPGTYDAAICLMDTFRFLLTNEDIRDHLRAVAQRLSPGGLYLTDFWVPSQWDMMGNEIHQWEQTDGDTTVRVFYLQHPDSVDPVTQTFEDELVFEVHEGGQTKEIRGGPTRTRLILPQEFAALVEGSGAFDVAATYGEFDLAKPFDRSSLSWRMISVLKKR